MMKPGSSKSDAKKSSTKRRYVAPRGVSLTLTAAKAELEAKAIPGDSGGQEMLKRINDRLRKKRKRGER